MPRRIQRKRTKGWRMPESAVYVGRPSRWGNPAEIVENVYEELGYDAAGRLRPLKRRRWMVLSDMGVPMSEELDDLAEAREIATEWYESAVLLPTLLFEPDWLEPLRGHDLACWCALDSACHADVLLRYANMSPAEIEAVRREMMNCSGWNNG